MRAVRVLSLLCVNVAMVMACGSGGDESGFQENGVGASSSSGASGGEGSSSGFGSSGSGVQLSQVSDTFPSVAGTVPSSELAGIERERRDQIPSHSRAGRGRVPRRTWKNTGCGPTAPSTASRSMGLPERVVIAPSPP